MKKPYLIAEILLKRGMPITVVKEITNLADHEIRRLKISSTEPNTAL
ncbi:hypothetical protein [Bacillus sp. V5-8f]|nr:hypothetical protein [Bacillus sp. V5-8f]